MLKVVLTSGDEDIFPPGFDDKLIYCHEEMINYCPPPEEERMTYIENSLSFRHRTWIFLVVPARLAAMEVYNGREFLGHW